MSRQPWAGSGTHQGHSARKGQSPLPESVCQEPSGLLGCEQDWTKTQGYPLISWSPWGLLGLGREGQIQLLSQTEHQITVNSRDRAGSRTCVPAPHLDVVPARQVSHIVPQRDPRVAAAFMGRPRPLQPSLPAHRAKVPDAICFPEFLQTEPVSRLLAHTHTLGCLCQALVKAFPWCSC